MARHLTYLLAATCLITLTACSYLPSWLPNGQANSAADLAPRKPDPMAPKLAALETRHFESVPQSDEVLGGVQVLFARYENTFAGLAREHNLGYQALRHANPTVDAWLPGEGTPIYLPTMYVLPEAPRDGIVINLPTMRLLYFTGHNTEAAATVSVTSHPIGIGREGWSTPTGEARVTQKARAPTWYPPASVRAEHAAAGDPLPSIVPPGPDNPLGNFTMKLSMPGYLIHGTNKPAGVGMRVSHGCIRLYPEDIEALFDRVPMKTPVYIVDQPVLAGWRDGELYLEVHPPLSEDERDLEAETQRVIEAALVRAGSSELQINAAAITKIVLEKRGIPFPILGWKLTPEHYLGASRVIENSLPASAADTTASR